MVVPSELFFLSPLPRETLPAIPYAYELPSLAGLHGARDPRAPPFRFEAARADPFFRFSTCPAQGFCG